MYKITFLILCFTTLLFGNIDAIVSIVPQKTILKNIAKDKIDITVMVQTGSSPHNYEPKPSQMKDVAKADLYFSIGVEFENIWLDRFYTQNKNMKIIDISKGIKKNKDPHIWTNTNKIKKIALNTYSALIKYDPKNYSFYTKNYNNYIKKINQTTEKIKEILKNTPENSKFMVFHPSWGYFAQQFHLIQLPIQIDGKAPKPKDIIKLIQTAKKQNIKAIFTAPEFSQKSAQTIAQQLNINVIRVSPLDPNLLENLVKLAKAIAN